MEKEFILCAALDYNGIIVSAHRHSDCYKLLQELRPDILNEDLPQRKDQGFLTSLNRYVNRKEGWKIAKDNNQIRWGLEASENGEESQLISENLY